MGSRGHLSGYVHPAPWPEIASGSLPGSELVVKISKISLTFSFFCNKQAIVKGLVGHYGMSIPGGPWEITEKSGSRPWPLLLCPALI